MALTIKLCQVIRQSHLDIGVEPMTSLANEIRLTRTIQAPSSRVYAAFTRAEGWCEWCCEKAEADASIEGRLHIYTEGYNAYGEFTELERDKLIAFTWDGDGEPPTHIHVMLNRQDDSTLMTFKVAILDAEKDWGSFADFLERTWGRALDNLKIVLECNPEI